VPETCSEGWATCTLVSRLLASRQGEDQDQDHDATVSKPGRQPQHNQRSMRRLLEAQGWTCETGGKHVIKMTKPGHRPITLPHDKRGGGYPPGLAAAILREAGLKGRTGDE